MSSDAYRSGSDRFQSLESETLRRSGEPQTYGFDPQFSTSGMAAAFLMEVRDRLSAEGVRIIPDSISLFQADLLWGCRFEAVKPEVGSLWKRWEARR